MDKKLTTEIFPLLKDTEYHGACTSTNKTHDALAERIKVKIIYITPSSKHANYYFLNFIDSGEGTVEGFERPAHKDFILDIILERTNGEAYEWTSEGHPGWDRNQYLDEHPISPLEQDVYFIYAMLPNVVKIGISNCIEGRIDALQCLSPVPLEIIGAIPKGGSKLERKLHKRFKHLRSHGEWFHYTEELKAYIEKLEVS